jgi:host factor-I protein
MGRDAINRVSTHCTDAINRVSNHCTDAINRVSTHYLPSLQKMITDFDTSLPSIRQVQNLIKQTTPVEFKLLTGDVLTGRVLWQDAHCICIADENSQQTTIWKQAIAYIQPKS